MSPKNKKTNLKRPETTSMVSIIAHQMKTPVSAIKGYLEALKAGDCGKVNRAQEEYFTDALENVKRIFDFIETLLEVSIIEDKQFQIKIKPVALEKIITEVLKDLSPWIEANNCQVFFKKPEKLPNVLTDIFRISQAVRNFITNAVLYKEGKGRVEISLEQKGKDLLFICKDNGIGIPKEDLNKVFSKFYRSEEAMSLDPSGSGLDLFISQAVIEMSGGKIWFEKNKGRGMTFYFSLPIAKN